MDVKTVNTFSEVLANTFESAFGAKPFRTGDFQRLEGDIKNPDALICILTFSGDLIGTLLLTFPEDTAKKIYKALMFEEIKTPGEETKDAFTEIMNMISGNISATLSDCQLEFDQPITAIGRAVYENTDKLPWLHIPMAFKDWGRFHYLLSLKEA